MPVTNPTDELNGLLADITAATTGVIGRVVVVRNRDVDGFWEGTWPLIILRLADFNLTRIAGGQTGLKGQQGREQNVYAIEIRDVIDPRSTAIEKVASSQSDCYTLMGAILDYFDHLPNQSLPVGNTATAYKAGEYIRFRQIRPFQQEDGGEINIVLAGTISVIGLARSGSAT